MGMMGEAVQSSRVCGVWWPVVCMGSAARPRSSAPPASLSPGHVLDDGSIGIQWGAGDGCRRTFRGASVVSVR
jgi:hypothetical protein